MRVKISSSFKLPKVKKWEVAKWEVAKRKAEISKNDKDSSKKIHAAAKSLGPGLYVHINFGGQILNSLVNI